MAQEIARLELQQEIVAKNGVSAHEIVVYRPTCRGMTEVLDQPFLPEQVERFVKHACRAVNGGAEPLEFEYKELDYADAQELGQFLVSLSDEADEVSFEENGDGVSSPLIYTLRRPVTLSKDGEVLHQIAFEARRIKDISDYLDAQRSGETKEFHAFMRVFGKPLGISVPVMSDAIIDAMDYLDYIVIRRKIMGKFTLARKRWKRSS